ncbi:hypothetical protein [Exiguobacterium sp. s193]|uniref:hypothetical protein n=1 Tax=Exiguobacterium sp. s193 TaxID=2751207 RepID=UPI001BEC2630|nr:hypothetical protein [Exiguobacterium sp. s193]
MKAIEIAFVCESGLVGSVMGAQVLRKRLQQEKLQVTVRTYRVQELPSDASFIVGPERIIRNVLRKAGDHVFFINQVLIEAAYDDVIITLRKELSRFD